MYTGHRNPLTAQYLENHLLDGLYDIDFEVKKKKSRVKPATGIHRYIRRRV
jgi:hypothetical protein